MAFRQDSKFIGKRAKTAVTHVVLVLLVANFVLSGCRATPVAATARNAASSSPEFVVGGVYSLDNSCGVYYLAKVLEVVDGLVVCRVCRNAFARRPGVIEPKSLVPITEPDMHFGSGYLAMLKQDFICMRPELLFEQKVSGEERDRVESFKRGDREAAGFKKLYEAINKREQELDREWEKAAQEKLRRERSKWSDGSSFGRPAQRVRKRA